MENILKFTLSDSGVLPNQPVCAGVQGEHRATALVFEPDSKLKEDVESRISDSGQAVYRVDLVTAAGEVFSGEEKDFANIDEPFYLTSAMTESGLDTVAVFRLIIKQNENRTELYKAQIKLYFIPSPIMPASRQKEKLSEAERLLKKAEEIFAVLDQKTARAEELIAVRTAAVSEIAARTAAQLNKVNELTAEIKNLKAILEQQAEFVFVGGDSKTVGEIGIEVDSGLSDQSSNPVENKAVTEKFYEIEQKVTQNTQEISSAEKVSNKVTQVDENSTDEQYPSAKLLYGLQSRMAGLDAGSVKHTKIGGEDGVTSLIKWCNSNVVEGVQIIEIGEGIEDAPEKFVQAIFVCNNVTDWGYNGTRTLIIAGKRGDLYIRVYYSDTSEVGEFYGWTDWYKFSGTKITVGEDE